MRSYRFPKKERLSRKKLWDEVFSKGGRLKASPLLLFYLKAPLPEDVPVQAGFSVPKRSFPRAVDPNHIERLMKEASRLEKPGIFNNMQGSYAFVFLYLGKDKPDFQHISRAMRSVLNKFKQHEQTTDN